MSYGLAEITLVGYAAGAPNMTFNETGSARLTFRLAVNRKSRLKTTVEWFTVRALGKRAEAVKTMIKKGSQMMVTGRYRSSSYTTNDGEKRLVAEVLADHIIVLGSKPESLQTQSV